MKKREGEFRPLFPPINPTEVKEEGREQKEGFHKTIEEMRRKNSLLMSELERIKNENERLRKELERMEENLRKKEEENKRLLSELKKAEDEKFNTTKLCKEINTQLEGFINELKEKLIQFIRRILEDFSMRLPQTEALREDLENILSELTNYRLPIKIYVNPKDFVVLEGFFSSLKEKLKREGLEIQLITDDKLREGEVLIKSEQFYVERNPEEFAKEIFEKVYKYVFKRD